MDRSFSPICWSSTEVRRDRGVGCILRCMKIETTILLSEDLVAALLARATDPERRSELVEAALREFLPLLQKRDTSRDLEIINANASELNEEAEDVLSYQVIP